MSKGFMLVMMQPPPALEEEFNDWYDTEHVPERLAVPGFETALRYISLAGAPRYLAMYDLASAQVLESPEYMRVSFDKFSPWTRRVTSRVRVYRSAGDQIYPGNAVTQRAARVSVLRFRALGAESQAKVVAGMRENFERRPEVSQVRVFAYPTPAGTDYLGFVEARTPTAETLDLAAFQGCDKALDLFVSYTPL